MGDGTNGNARLVNEDIDVARTNLAKEMLKPSFDKVIPIMSLENDGVADNHDDAQTIPITGGPSTGFLIALEIGGRKIPWSVLSGVVSVPTMG